MDVKRFDETTSGGHKFSVETITDNKVSGAPILGWESGHASIMGMNFHSILATGDGLIYSLSGNGGASLYRVVDGVAGIILESGILKRAKDYADHDDYQITRAYLYGLIDLFSAVKKENADLLRQKEDAEACQKCLEKQAEQAYGAVADAAGACVGYWRDGK